MRQCDLILQSGGELGTRWVALMGKQQQRPQEVEMTGLYQGVS